MPADYELILVCNAHLDPVWLWDWPEGLAECLATFRTAAALCREFDGFVFNHNEALLYHWVEEHDPELFTSIRELVMAKKWHIMGGWVLQPDCNLPAGESLVRQVIVGKNYFRRRFGVEPTVAVNFDSFGHSRGLVQILKKSGYTGYLFCRPTSKEIPLADDFIWTGNDGSEILAHRSRTHYNSSLGKARERVEKWLAENQETETGLLLWGVGDHGGGPSRKDLEDLQSLIAETEDVTIRHGTPESYFRHLEKRRARLPRHGGDINPWAVGCYTSMARVKDKHRRLEGQYMMTEKMITTAAVQGLLDYPRENLGMALDDLLFSQFHDIITGDAAPSVESSSLQRLDHGLEILSRLKTRAFFAFLSGQKPAAEGEYPVFIYNPHPFAVEQIVECEFQPPEVHSDRTSIRMPNIADAEGRTIPCQLEKEESNIADDWRKRVVFHASLQPSRMNRFTVRLELQPRRPIAADSDPGSLAVRTGRMEIAVNPKTGLLDYFLVKGRAFMRPGACRLLVVEDDADPWGMRVRSFRKVEGEFRLMTPEQAARFSGIALPRLAPVRVIESGPVRQVMEALLAYNGSAACIHYAIPNRGSEFEVSVRVMWQEKNRMLKLSLPGPFQDGSCLYQTAYGVEQVNRIGEELPGQKWLALLSADRRACLTVVTENTHGFDFADGELRLSLLRSAAHAAHPAGEGIPIVPQDRFTPRLDQGEHLFRFRLDAGPAEERLTRIDREALVANEPPMVLCCMPGGSGVMAKPGPCLSDEAVQITAFKKAEEGGDLIIRLFEPTGQHRTTVLFLPFVPAEKEVVMEPFEIKTLRFHLASLSFTEVDLLERELE